MLYYSDKNDLLHNYRWTIREREARVQPHELEQLDGHQGKIHTAVDRGVCFRREVQVVQFAHGVLKQEL
jgi:hypothetical protein